MNAKSQLFLSLLVAALVLLTGEIGGQALYSSGRPLASNVIVPQTRSFAVGNRGEVDITEVNVGVVILEQAATTTMEISLKNPTARRLEAELIVPVPAGAVVRGFTFQGAASEPTAQLLPKEEAKRIYDGIVAKMRDPALLEFMGYNLIRSSVFPVEARGSQKVRLTFEHILPADGNRVDYVLPRSESLDYTIPWNVSVNIKSRKPISTVYSPSHKLETARSGENQVSARVADDATREPGPFRLSYLLEGDGVTASLFAYPDPEDGGGYFLLLAGLPSRPPQAADGPPIKREVTIVLDRSGSMRGEKIEQVREAALQILAGLEEGEAFNIVLYNEAVEVFSTMPVIKTERNVEAASAYLKGVGARGGTNIHDALLETLRQKPAKGMLPIVLFLTDGLPTVGQTSEVAIRNVAIKANPYERRIFTFGVGVDVNAPLLDKIASETRATSTYVLPKEDVEVKVAQVFRRLSGPVLARPSLEIIGSGTRLAFAGRESEGRSDDSPGQHASAEGASERGQTGVTGEVHLAHGGDVARVRDLFRSVIERNLDPVYAREDEAQRFKWSDIPILLDLAESERVLTTMPALSISSYVGKDGREGMVALWLIEGLRRGQERMTEKEQTKPKTFPRLSGVWPPLNPICVKEGIRMTECENSAEIHREVRNAYRRWWDAAKTLSPKEAALFDPLDLTDLAWWGAPSQGELEVYDAMSPDGVVARRLNKAWRGPVLKTTYYTLDRTKVPKGEKKRIFREGPFDKSILTVQKVVLHCYDEKGKEIRTEEYLPPRLTPTSAPGGTASPEPPDLETGFPRVRDVIPSRLPDLFEGDQLVVLGKYMGEEPLRFKLSGNYLGRERTFRFTFDLDKATTRNAFVPRLWASRKIGVLAEAIRQLGADEGPLPSQRRASADPRLKELVDEIVDLGTRFGILTEYTAFLAREGTDLSRRDEVLALANRNFMTRAVATRSGLGSVNQSFNNNDQMNQQVLNRRNEYFDERMNRVAVSTVQQVNDMAFYRRGNRWVDSRIVDREEEAQPTKVIEFGSEEFRELALRLAGQGRQGSVSLRGDILMTLNGELILVKGPAAQ